MSDIAIDRPLLPGALLLLGGFVLLGAVWGAIGLPRVGDGFQGAVSGALVVSLVGTIGFLVMSVVLHLMARVFEGIASYGELASALLFALLPLYLLAPTALLRLLPGGLGGFLFFLTILGTLGWVTRLVYLAVRESHRFIGTQAVLTMLTPILFTVLLVMVLFFLSIFGVLILG